MSFRRPIQFAGLLMALVVSGSLALAQEQVQQGPTKQPLGDGMSHDQMQMMHQQMVPGSQTLDTASPTMPGQDTFGAIQEIVRILEADPKTDWSKVNLEALRQHLIDMSEVMLKADAVTKLIDGGIEVTATGTVRTVDAKQAARIREELRMVDEKDFAKELNALIKRYVDGGCDPQDIADELLREANSVFGHYNLEIYLEAKPAAGG